MDVKTCNKCYISKNLIDFRKHKNVCKLCYKEHNKRYFKKYYIQNKEVILKRNANNYANNKNKDTFLENLKTKRRNYFIQNRETILERNTNRYSLNRDSILERRKQRYKTDFLYKLKQALRNRLNSSLKRKKLKKTIKQLEYLGCSIDELKLYLESKFQDGMSWENHQFNGWHIDHIIPLSSAKTEDEVYKLCHYTNLQPLWAKDNLSKGIKYEN